MGHTGTAAFAVCFLLSCSDIIAFKAASAGTSGAGSLSIDGTANTATASASGSYTFWQDDSTGVGATRTLVPDVTTVQQCLDACDAAGESSCAGVIMTGVTAPASAPTTCHKVYGNSTAAVYKRSVTKTVVTRLQLEDLLS
jgi:hypothetical protein